MSTLTATMTTTEVANKLIKLCREGKNVDAINSLYSDTIVSIEPKGSQHEKTEGKKAVLAKTEQWFATVEQFHGATISEPIIADNFFSCNMDMDVTLKGIGRIRMNEIAVYEVKNGQIVFEQFFFTINN